MTRWAVTIVSAAGVALAIWISLRFGGRAHVVETRDPDEPVGAWPGAAHALRLATAAVFSGAITMALVVGFGGRLFMRIAAATSSESVQGMLTDAEERIGAVTIDGTFEFVLFFTLFFGGFIGVVYGLLRRCLPGPAWFSGLVVAVIVAGIAGANDFADPNNHDFALLEPTWFLALMEVGLVVLFGTTLGATYAWLRERLPKISRSRDGLWYLPLAPMTLMPANFVLVAFAGLGGAVVPQGSRDVFTSRVVTRAVGTIAAVAFAFFGATLATNLLQIAF